MQQLARRLGGARRDRTDDLLRARQALSQLSYGPSACPFAFWRCWLFARGGHLPVCKLPCSLTSRLASTQNSCVSSLEVLKGVIFRLSRRSFASHSSLCKRSFNAEIRKMVGLGRFELPTSPLSGVRSNQLSYRPKVWRCLNVVEQGPGLLQSSDNL